MENEEWKDIPNYDGLYKVSNLGNVKSFNTKTNHKQPINLKQTMDRKNGYLKYYASLVADHGKDGVNTWYGIRLAEKSEKA